MPVPNQTGGVAFHYLTRFVLPGADKKEQRDDVGASCEELVGIPEATNGAEEQGRASQVPGHRLAERPEHLDQRLGSENSHHVPATHEEATAGDRAQGQR